MCWTFGIHHFDSLRRVLGVNPVSLMARCSRAPWSAYRHGSTTEALLEMEHNIHVQYHGSLTSNRNEQYYGSKVIGGAVDQPFPPVVAQGGGGSSCPFVHARFQRATRRDTRVEV
jgi:hypothetical protein